MILHVSIVCLIVCVTAYCKVLCVYKFMSKHSPPFTYRRWRYSGDIGGNRRSVSIIGVVAAQFPRIDTCINVDKISIIRNLIMVLIKIDMAIGKFEINNYSVI